MHELGIARNVVAIVGDGVVKRCKIAITPILGDEIVVQIDNIRIGVGGESRADLVVPVRPWQHLHIDLDIRKLRRESIGKIGPEFLIVRLFAAGR